MTNPTTADAVIATLRAFVDETFSGGAMTDAQLERAVAGRERHGLCVSRADLRLVLARLAECEARGTVDITKARDVDCYEIRYLVPRVQVHDYKGSDYAGVVGREIAHKWRETFDAAREGVRHG